MSLSAFHCIVPCKRGSIWHKQDRRNSIPTLHPSICDCILEHQKVLDPSATAKFKNLSDFWAQTFLIHPIHPSQTILLQLWPLISYKIISTQNPSASTPKSSSWTEPCRRACLMSCPRHRLEDHPTTVTESLVSSSPECFILYIIGSYIILLYYIYILYILYIRFVVVLVAYNTTMVTNNFHSVGWPVATTYQFC